MIDVTKAAELPLTVLRRIVSNSTTPNNLPEFNKMTRLNPITNVSGNVARMPAEFQGNLMQALLGIFCANYLQAFSILSAKTDINTIQLLESVSTSGSGYSRFGESVGQNIVTSMEKDGDLPSYAIKTTKHDGQMKPQEQELAVGRILNVSIQLEGGRQFTIPVTAQIIPRVITPEAFARAAAKTNIDTSYIGRSRELASGKIESIADYLFGLDLIRDDMAGRVNDKDGLYKIASDSRHPRWVKEILNNEKHINRISMMSVMSTEDVEAINAAVRGNILKSRNVREKYLDDTAQTTVAVVDARRERVYLVQRAIDEVSVLNFDDIKRMGSRKDGVDVNSLIKDLMQGQSGL